jgi:hypothetical protein
MKRENKSIYINIYETEFFTKYQIYPMNMVQLHFFCTTHDDYGIIPKNILNTICDNYLMSSLQLDGLFLMISYLYQYCLMLNDKLYKFVINQIYNIKTNDELFMKFKILLHNNQNKKKKFI